MKCQRQNRTLVITELPRVAPDGTTIDLDSLEVEIRYKSTGNVGKALALDHVVIPAIVKALNGQPPEGFWAKFQETED